VNALVKHEAAALPALQAMTEAELISVMQTSIYPGAKLESIKMVLGYCKATGLDPMKKPVHIVPMKVSTGEKDKYGNDKKETRDVIMPGVGSYRTDAARTGQYAGMGDPEFGPTITLEYEADDWYDVDEGGNTRRAKRKVKRSLKYPEWCRITVERIVDGEPRKFTAREFWVENYATRGSDGAPNDMWAKRPIGQLVKCTEAQALRKAFPETISAQPTADEMEGKTMDEGVVIDASTGEISGGKKEPEKQTTLPAYPADKFAHNLKNTWAKRVAEGSDPANLIIKLKTLNTLSADQEAAVMALKPAATAGGDAPDVTAAQVLEKLNASATSEDLDAAAGLIPAVPEAERAALNARYDELHAKFNPQE
jgi:phage recombination protein Bet